MSVTAIDLSVHGNVAPLSTRTVDPPFPPIACTHPTRSNKEFSLLLPINCAETQMQLTQP
jgi:hypothetical protein